jgi:hypothetical protein
VSEIHRLDQPDRRPRPKIVGAADIDAQGRPRVLDSSAKQEPVTPEIRVHSQTISEEDKIRVGDRRVDEPQVRIRASDQKAWQRVKRVED